LAGSAKCFSTGEQAVEINVMIVNNARQMRIRRELADWGKRIGGMVKLEEMHGGWRFGWRKEELLPEGKTCLFLVNIKIGMGNFVS
jgi:hypothetical protein